MNLPKPAVLCCAAFVAACSDPPQERTVPSRSPVAARGMVTILDAHRAPEVVPVPPERIVKAGPFDPVGDQGVAAGAIAHTRTYTTDDGLPMDDITCGYRAPNGMLWFGSNGGGITRYDGRSFTNYTMAHGLPDNTILSLGGDRKGNIWIGTSTGGLCRFDGHRFTTHDPARATGLSRGINCILEDNHGVMWFGSRGHGIFRFDENGFSVHPVIDPQGSDLVLDMAITRDGVLWAATSHGLARHNGGRFEQVLPVDGDSLRDVSSMIPDASGSLWLGRSGGGVTRYRPDEAHPKLTRYPLLGGDPVRVSQMIPDGTDAYWIASNTHGALKFRPQDQAPPEVRQFSLAQGLVSQEVMCVVMGHHGDVWLGTRGAGLVHYRGEALSTFRGFKPISIAEDPQGTLWVGSGKGIARYDGHAFHEQTEGFSDQGWNYSVSIDPKGRVGFGKNLIDPHQYGISWFDGTSYHVTAILDDRRFPDIFWTFHDRRGRLWVGGRRGAECYDHGYRTTYSTQQGLGSNLVLFIGEDASGGIWAGTDGGGFSRIDGAQVTTWTTAEGLPNNVVWSVVPEAPGTIWVTTLAGICRFDGHSFLSFNTQHGLPDDNINQALLARDGNALYVGTLNGLAVITGWRDPSGRTIPFMALSGLPNDSVARYVPEIEVYNATTGFPIKDVQTAEHAIYEDTDGIVWVATGSDKTGLVRLDRRALRTDTLPLSVELLRVSPGPERSCWYDLEPGCDSATLAQQEARAFGRVLNHEEREVERERYQGVTFGDIIPFSGIPQDLRLNYQNNRIAFEFVGIETARPELVEYRYILEGYDEDWSVPTRSNHTNYGNIHEGDHTFKVQAKSPDGIWSEPLEYRFTVLPPAHRTWWAFTLYGMAAAAGVTLVFRRRTAVLRAQKDRLERTVAVRTEELRRKKDEADEQRHRAEFSEKAKEQFLANMSHEIRTPMNAIMGMSDILRNRPHSPEQGKYLNAIAQSSENLLVIINDILDLSKIDAGRIDLESVPFEVRSVIGNVQEIMRFKAEQKGVHVELDVAEDVPFRLVGDPTRLNQIVLNLAGNAVKFTEHGSVTMLVRCAPDPKDRSSHILLVVDIIDTGIGIPEDRIEKIFEEFTQAYSDTTRKYGGTGLGLTISKRLTELQGGRITVKSERGRGSTFTVSIPYGLMG